MIIISHDIVDSRSALLDAHFQLECLATAAHFGARMTKNMRICAVLTADTAVDVAKVCILLVIRPSLHLQ